MINFCSYVPLLIYYLSLKILKFQKLRENPIKKRWWYVHTLFLQYASNFSVSCIVGKASLIHISATCRSSCNTNKSEIKHKTSVLINVYFYWFTDLTQWYTHTVNCKSHLKSGSWFLNNLTTKKNKNSITNNWSRD